MKTPATYLMSVVSYVRSDLFNDAVSIAGYTHWNVRLWGITN